MIVRAVLAALLLLLFVDARVASAKGLNDELLEALSLGVLGESNPVDLGDGYGWHAVLFAEEAIPDFEKEFINFDGTEPSKQRIRHALKYLDHPVAVKDGVAFPKEISISEEWIKLTNDLDFHVLNELRDDVRYQPVDRIGAAFGFYDVQHSDAYASYLRLQQHDSVLNRSLVGENAAWRLVPELSTDPSVFDAKREVSWRKRFQGWSDEIETIGLALELRALSLRILNNNEFIDKEPDIWLAPTLYTWSTANIWQRGRFDLRDLDASADFELARVKILRPWFFIDELISGRLELNKASVRTTTPISNGETPSLDRFPSGGLLTVYPEEIIIVRKVHWEGSGGSQVPSDRIRPLNFSFKSINLLAFVVRVLPRLPK